MADAVELIATIARFRRATPRNTDVMAVRDALEKRLPGNEILDCLAEQVADSEVAWSLGSFGAIAEFTCDAEEMATSIETMEAWRR